MVASLLFADFVQMVGPVLHHLAPLGEVLGVDVGRSDLVALCVRQLPINDVSAISQFA